MYHPPRECVLYVVIIAYLETTRYLRVDKHLVPDMELVIPAYITRKGQGCFMNGPHDVPDEVFTKEYWDRRLERT